MNRFNLIALAICASFAGQMCATSATPYFDRLVARNKRAARVATAKAVVKHPATLTAAGLAVVGAAGAAAAKCTVRGGNVAKAAGTFVAAQAGNIATFVGNHKTAAKVTAAAAFVAYCVKHRAQIAAGLKTGYNGTVARAKSVVAWAKANPKKTAAIIASPFVVAAIVYNRARLASGFARLRAKLPALKVPAMFKRKAAVVLPTAAEVAEFNAAQTAHVAAEAAQVAAQQAADKAAQAAAQQTAMEGGRGASKLRNQLKRTLRLV